MVRVSDQAQEPFVDLYKLGAGNCLVFPSLLVGQLYLLFKEARIPRMDHLSKRNKWCWGRERGWQCALLQEEAATYVENILTTYRLLPGAPGGVRKIISRISILKGFVVHLLAVEFSEFGDRHLPQFVQMEEFLGPTQHSPKMVHRNEINRGQVELARDREHVV